MGITVSHNVLCQNAIQAGNSCQQGRRCSIDIDTDRIDAVFHSGIERARQDALVDIVLVLADTDCFWFDFDEFGQGILQAPGNRYRTAQTDINSGNSAAAKADAE